MRLTTELGVMAYSDDVDKLPSDVQAELMQHIAVLHISTHPVLTDEEVLLVRLQPTLQRTTMQLEMMP